MPLTSWSLAKLNTKEKAIAVIRELVAHYIWLYENFEIDPKQDRKLRAHARSIKGLSVVVRAEATVSLRQEPAVVKLLTTCYPIVPRLTTVLTVSTNQAQNTLALTRARTAELVLIYRVRTSDVIVQLGGVA